MTEIELIEDIRLIRLETGEDLIGIVRDSDNKGTILLENPVVMQMLVMETTEKLMLVPYIPFTTNAFCYINRDKIISISEIHSTLQQYYLLSVMFAQKEDHPALDRIAFTNQLMEFEAIQDMFPKHRLLELSRTIN